MFMKRTHWFMSISLLCFFTGSVWSQAVENSDLEKLSRRPVPKQPASTEKSSDTLGELLLQTADQISASGLSINNTSNLVIVAPVGEKFKIAMPGSAQATAESEETRMYGHKKMGQLNHVSVTVYPRYFAMTEDTILHVENENMEEGNLNLRARAAREGPLSEGAGIFYDGRRRQNGLTFHQYRYIFPEYKYYMRIYFQPDKIYVVRTWTKSEAQCEKFLSSFRLGPVNHDTAQSNIENVKEQ